MPARVYSVGYTTVNKIQVPTSRTRQIKYTGISGTTHEAGGVPGRAT